MKTPFLLTLALVIILSLAACVGEADTTIASSSTIESSEPTKSQVLVNATTEQGVSLKLPSDM